MAWDLAEHWLESGKQESWDLGEALVRVAVHTTKEEKKEHFIYEISTRSRLFKNCSQALAVLGLEKLETRKKILTLRFAKSGIDDCIINDLLTDPV